MTDSSGSSRDNKPPAKIRFVASQVILFIFGIPFAAFGVFAFYDAWKNWHGNIHNPVVTIIFGLIFSAIGLGIMTWAATAGHRRKKAEEKFLKQTDGGAKPWLSRADWAAGRIKSTSTTPVGFLLLWSFLALALSAPAILAISKEWQKGNRLILVVLLFPAVAFYLLGYSFVKWRSRRRFGDSFFEPAQIPAPLGGTLEGMILTGAPLKLEQGLHLKISCIRCTVSASGETQTVHQSILWQDEKIFNPKACLPDPEPGRSGIPVFFKLPADQPECFSRDNQSVFWRLEAKSKIRGPDFSVAFNVPVFKVPGAADAGETDEPDPTAAFQEPVEQLRQDEHSKIQISNGPNGREFYFPAARNPGTAVFITLFMLVFNGVAVVTLHFDAPILFPIVFGLIGLLLIFVTFNLWFKSSRVTIDSSGVRVTKRWLMFSQFRTFAAKEIVRFDTKAGIQSGTTVFWDIKLVTNGSEDSFAATRKRFQKTGQRPPLKFSLDGSSGFTLASGVTSAPEANWLVQEMTKALGREP
ncbi:MAG TPA: hypothetical protein VFY06_06315 [Verrucomicrobiae bacterium]|nr:hypothetical protein [Verrucomicrobiae bacterium]